MASPPGLAILISPSSLSTTPRFIERVEKTILDSLLNSSLLKKYSPKWIEKLGYEGEREHLLRIQELSFKDKRTQGQLVVQYHHGKRLGIPVGRVFARGSLSLGCLRREIRATLTKHLYYDVDIKNAHPSILLQIFTNLGVDLPRLREYVETRDAHLGVLQEVLGISRDRAKNLFIRILYGGSLNAWISGKGGDEDDDDEPITNFQSLPDSTISFLKEYEKEVKDVVLPSICRANPDIVDMYQKQHARDPVSSTASCFAQTIERQALEAMVKYLSAKKLLSKPGSTRRADGIVCKEAILCFDGVMILKEAVESSGDVLDVILEDMRGYVRKSTGLSLGFEVKEPKEFYKPEDLLSSRLSSPSVDIVVPESALDGAFALCEEFTRQFPGCVKTHTDGRMMVYCPRTGMWSQNKGLLMDYVLTHWKGERPLMRKDSKERWGDRPKTLKDALEHILPSLCRDDAWFEDAVQSNSAGKILLRDGYFDFDKNEFHEGFTADIVFHHQANIAFKDPVKPDVKNLVYKVLFKDTVREGNLTLDALLHTFAKAIAFRLDRAIGMGSGPPATGKSGFISLASNTFGNYVMTCDANSFSKSKFATEDADKQLHFLIQKRYARALMMSEKSQHPISSERAKALSGGDLLNGRSLYSNSITFRPHFTMFFFSNSVEDAFDKVDSALIDRLRCWSYDKQFVLPGELKDPETQMVRDDSVKEKLQKDPEWARAFFEIVCDAYYSPCEDGLKQSRELARKMAVDMDADSQALNEVFHFTHSPEDFILTTDIQREYEACPELRRRFPTFNKLKNALKDKGIVASRCKKQGEMRDKYGFAGIRLVSREDAMIGEDVPGFPSLSPPPTNIREVCKIFP